ncbi:MAG: Gfo/Idh/MocA family oxidoreductase [Clostridiales bacterium]|nr:Gfo/Idh/MocA family oxidoreductase [Clostridiales bacterium]
MFNVGIIGCGSITVKRHAIETNANDDTKIFGVYDPNNKHAKAMADKYNCKIYDSVDDLLTDDNLSIVIVATPNIFHGEYTIKALENGKHVLCEKPMAATLELAQEMIDTAKKYNLKLMIGQNQRLVPAHIKAKEILDSGELGRILTFQTVFGHRGAEKWSIANSPSTWFFDKEQAIFGAMGDIGVHKADLVRWLIGEEFKAVSSFVTTRHKRYDNNELINVDDNAVSILQSESGIVGTLAVSWTYYGGESNATIFNCEKGALWIFRDEDAPIKIKYANGSETLIKIGTISTNEKQVSSGVIDMLTDAIINNKKVDIDGYEGYKALEIIVNCVKSAESGQTIHF